MIGNHQTHHAFVAPAKINLCLHIVGINQNNYHLLDGVSVFAIDGDHINFSINHADSLMITGDYSEKLQENLSDNLVIQAVKALRSIRDFPFLQINLIKNIPLGAGFGGGSSDAAAIMNGINKAFQLDLSFSELSTLGQKIGADIPMCLLAKPCRTQGIGEILTPLTSKNKAYDVLLLKPKKSLATPLIFSALTQKNNPPIPDDVDILDYALTEGRNDLQNVAIEYIPKIKHYLDTLWTTNPIKAAMSGSGSGLFSLYEHQENRDKSYEYLKHDENLEFLMKSKIYI